MEFTILGLIATLLLFAAAFVAPTRAYLHILWVLDINKTAVFVNLFSFVNNLYLLILSSISYLSTNSQHFSFVNLSPPPPIFME